MVIGVLGGMGTYATLNAFKQYADVFEAEKEWERPRIIIDNRCTMPSRVRAFLYNEKRDELISEMIDSLKNLSRMGCDRIILACNTSHLFLDDIYKKVPEIELKIVHLIENCVSALKNDNVNKVFLIASEATIESGIFQKELASVHIDCVVPNHDDYDIIRTCIEAVKQNDYNEHVKELFLYLVNKNDVCILGCTEFPVLYEKYYLECKAIKVYDPLLLAIQHIKEEYINEKNSHVWGI